uniref:Putative structural protein n=1 Tax=viral metagenome TaxID=1070528 RepID=A0A6M3INN9_9ZZZZ
MANQDHPHGLRPIRMLNSGPIPKNRYRAGTTTAIFQGDMVAMTGDGNVIRVAVTTGSADCVGVAANYKAAGSAAGTEVWVYDDPDTVFEIQSDGTTDTGFVTHIGAVAALINAAGSTTTGQSVLEIDASSITSTGTAVSNPIKIIDVYKGVDNDPDLAHQRMEVLITRHLYRERSGSV